MARSEGGGRLARAMLGNLRHPATTHENGNDIACDQNDGANNGEVVCPRMTGPSAPARP